MFSVLTNNIYFATTDLFCSESVHFSKNTSTYIQIPLSKVPGLTITANKTGK